ncbi:MAG: formylglycine-generating enzyme family protein, partial [Desulfobulbaceae bacterium]|nr:formylglycine-generating enzyme family protein [Desulfobulbaceae bacterium]
SGNAEYLTESHDEYVAQLLARFMPRFIKIPTGQYHIGCSHPRPNERPEQSITLKSFYIGQFPVTNDLFEIFVRETGYETSAEKHGYGNVIEGRYVSRTDTDSGRATLIVSNGTMEHRVAGANWRNPKGPGSNNKGKYNHPVVQISYADALAFAVWAGKRLPSEDEWEAAARGQDNRLFPWGNTWLLKLGNFESSALGDSTPVDHHGRESASPYGLYDMLGNVYEWTASLHHPANQHPESRNQIHILKGGCWASRKAIHIGHRMIEKGDRWSNIIGFRCAV